LAEKYQRNLSFHVKSVGEVFRALNANFIEFKKDLRAYDYIVVADGKQLELNDLTAASYGFNKMDIIPLTRGDKGDFIKSAEGVLLIAAGVVLDYFSFGTLGNPLILAGIGILSNVIMAHFMTPADYDKSDSGTQSNIFNGARNVSKEGVAIPIVYGEMVVGSLVASGFIAVDGSKI